jgi:chemotaxis protein methyltransferase CheR
MVGSSAYLNEIKGKIEKVSMVDTTVLIEGSTGTGKELVARCIHNLSMRREKPFIKVNCAALQISLVESELFGHEKGSFTGAHVSKLGFFEFNRNLNQDIKQRF